MTCPDQTHVVVQGCDKQRVTQFAAEVRSLRKPEPYKGKGYSLSTANTSKSSLVRQPPSNPSRLSQPAPIQTGPAMDKNKKLQKQRTRRRNHVRNVLRGTATRPRLSCSDRSSTSPASWSMTFRERRSLVPARRTRIRRLKPAATAMPRRRSANLSPKRRLPPGIKEAKLDRGHNKYHGRVKAFADAAREAGLTL